MSENKNDRVAQACKIWLVSTTSAEYINIWVSAFCSIFLIAQGRVPSDSVEAHLADLFPLSTWGLILGFTGLAHAASIWSSTNWLRYVCCGLELGVWCYIATALWLTGDTAPHHAFYLGLATVSFWILVRGPSSD